MAFISEAGPRQAASAATATRRLNPCWLFILLAVAVSVLMLRDTIGPVWQAGAFFDTDDAMRFLQIRSWLDGQAWYDVSAHRLNPPLGGSMHWSRIVDVPVAALIELFARFTDADTAGRLARLVFPTALLVVFYAGVARLAAVVLGRDARIPAVAAAMLGSAAVAQFRPGRIDHHAPQITLLVWCVASLLAAMEPRRARAAALAGICAATSLAISLENLPFLVGLAGALVTLWIIRGATMRAALTWFGAGFGLALPCLYLGTVAPDRWLVSVPDALSFGHLGAGVIGATGCAILAFATPQLDSRARRLAAAAGVAATIALFLALAGRGSLHGPFADVDPLVRDVWIAEVQESLPFLKLLRLHPLDAVIIMAPAVLGTIALFAMAWGARRDADASARLAILAGVSAIGLAFAFWQVRVFSSFTPLALIGGVAVAMAVRTRLAAAGRAQLASLAYLLLAPFTALGWTAALAAISEPAPATAASAHPDIQACIAPAALAPLAALPPGRVVAPIDAGPFLLVHTRHSAFAAPYHRNNDGNRYELDTFFAPPAATAGRMAARGATYLMICAGFGETARIADRAPNSLAAALDAGRVPPGLVQVPAAGTAYKVFRLAR